MGKLIISMAMFNSKLLNYQRVNPPWFSPVLLHKPGFLNKPRRHLEGKSAGATEVLVPIIVLLIAWALYSTEDESKTSGHGESGGESGGCASSQMSQKGTVKLTEPPNFHGEVWEFIIE